MTDECWPPKPPGSLLQSLLDSPLLINAMFLRHDAPLVFIGWVAPHKCSALLLPTSLKEKAETFLPPLREKHYHPCARARACETERSAVPLRRLSAPRRSSGNFTPVTSAEGLHSRPASPWHQSKSSCREANSYLFIYLFITRFKR